MTDRIEIYEGCVNRAMVASIASSFAPDEGDVLNVRKTNYRVIARSFTVDFADSVSQSRMVCVLIVKREGDTND